MTDYTLGPLARPTAAQRWSLLAVVSLGLLLIALDITILYTALPTLTRELGATAAQGLWIINAYPLVTAGLLLGAGTLGDRVGHRRMFLVGLLVFGLASLAAAFSPGAAALIAARACQAVGAAAMMPATLALIRLAFEDERERNLAISVWASLSLVGAAMGPLVGGFLLAHFWWGSVFLINVPVVCLAIVGTLLCAPRRRPGPARPWDLWSSLLGLVALSSLVAAIKQAAGAGSSWPGMLAALAAAGAAGAAFVRRQRRLAYPLLDFSLFRNAAFLSGVLGAIFVTFATGGLLLAIAQRFQLVAGYTPLQAGLLVAAIFLGTLPSSLLGGAFLHRIGLRWLIAGGLAVAALGVLLAAHAIALATADASAQAPAALARAAATGLPGLVAALALTGAGLGATISVASTAIVTSAPPHRAGMASSVEEVAYEFGNLIAVALLGSLLAGLYTAGVQLPAGAPAAAGQGVGQAMDWAAQAGPAGAAVAQAAAAAFDRAYLWVLHLVAAVLAAGAGLTAWLLRRHGARAATFAYKE
ncbi:MFS transporter [Orrella sp. JC864]|uniref:MFS transporter n=1 Tax=Orrella sp. JC864 TaxID=3120298 RepID=UPI00300AEAB6